MSEAKEEETQQDQQQQNQHRADSKSKSKKRDSKQVSELKQQVADLTQDLQRERSDFANYQRRAETEKGQIMSQAKSEVVSQLLPLLDDLERALSHIPQELQDNTWARGIGKVYEQVQEKLNEMGIVKIEALHQPFDPNLHEAVEFEEGEGDEEVVTEVRRTGYMLHENVLRPAMVKVGKAPAQSQVVNGSERSNSEEENDDISESEQ